MSLSMDEASIQARSEAARHAQSIRWAGTTPEQRRQATRKARTAAAVVIICNRVDELSDDDKDRILDAIYGEDRDR